MNRRLLAYLVLGLFAIPGAAQEKKNESKEALKALQDFIGGWKGNGGPLKAKPASSELWSETIEWGWKFKGDDAWITLKIDKGRHLKEGELRYLPAKKVYQLTLTDAKGGKREFEGEFKDNYLRLERTDPDTKEVQKITMNNAAEGVRFIYLYERKPENRTLFLKDYQVSATRIGESLGKKEKQNECVVSGGAGTMTVSFKGETFYVCCSGCRDEFNANPEKYVAEFKAKKK
jgi:YHS domain-containing protein